MKHNYHEWWLDQTFDNLPPDQQLRFAFLGVEHLLVVSHFPLPQVIE